MELPNRKSNRLQEYDYSQIGAYFVTICTKERKHLFEIETVGNMHAVSQKTLAVILL